MPEICFKVAFFPLWPTLSHSPTRPWRVEGVGIPRGVKGAKGPHKGETTSWHSIHSKSFKAFFGQVVFFWCLHSGRWVERSRLQTVEKSVIFFINDLAFLALKSLKWQKIYIFRGLKDLHFLKSFTYFYPWSLESWSLKMPTVVVFEFIFNIIKRLAHKKLVSLGSLKSNDMKMFTEFYNVESLSHLWYL